MKMITTINYKKILESLQHICYKYKLLEKYQVFDMNLKHEEKQHRHNFIYLQKICITSNFNKKPKTKFKIFANELFIEPTEHYFYTHYKKDSESIYGKMWINIEGLISLQTEHGVIVIKNGDMIKFLPFGGFILYIKDYYTDINPTSSNMYKYTFIPAYYKGKINLDYETKQRQIKIMQEYKQYDMNHYFDDIDDGDNL